MYIIYVHIILTRDTANDAPPHNRLKRLAPISPPLSPYILLPLTRDIDFLRFSGKAHSIL